VIVPIHNHSEYSTIDGVSTPKEIAKRVIVDMGCPCCGLTDHGVVAGHLDFDKQIRKVGGKPLFGCEVYHGIRFGEKLGNKRDQAHLIVVAMTDEGLKNLWRLNDAAAQEPKFHHVGRVNWTDLETFKDGLVVTSACALSLVCKGILQDDFSAFNRYLDIFGDNFYIELSTYPGDSLFFDKDSDEPVSPRKLNEALVDLARERGIPLVYGDDGHYAFPEQYGAHDAYVARSTGDSIYTPAQDRKMWHPEGALCIKTEEEVREALSYLPQSAVDEALSNSVDIGERADAHLPGIERRLPVFIPDDSPWVEKGKYADDEADLLFLDLIEKGMYRCYGENPDQRVIDQTAYEANIFLDDEASLYHYFLLAWDTLQFCHRGGDHPELGPIEVGPGRGSAAGCIVARELEITDIDPLPYDLYFERFWNPGRAKGFPDIDSDIERSRRREVKDYLTRRWGHDRVRSIGTVGRLSPKALVEKFASVAGLTKDEESTFRKFIDQVPDIDILGPDQIGWSEEVDPGKPIYVMHSTDKNVHDVGEQIVNWVEKLPAKRQRVVLRFLDLCEVLCNRAVNYGVHASGIVVCSDDLPELAPCRFAGSPSQRIPVTQFAMDDIDKLLMVKLDLLGLRTLDVLSDWRRQMKEVHGIEIEWSQLEWTELPDDFWDSVARKKAAGYFQCEKGYPAKLGAEAKPTSVSELSVLFALNRPGPIRSGAPASYIARRNGEQDDKFDGRDIPTLEEITSETFGWFIYQEQVIAYFREIGYSLSDADAVRKILGKKQPEKWDALYHGTGEWEGKGYLAMAQEAGVDREAAEVIWAVLEDFAKYSFNKSHTVAYATIAFRTIFAKYYGQSEFYMACIRNVDNQKRKIEMPLYINEARSEGIEVHGPDIEYSEALINVHDGDIYFGFSDVKGVSEDGSLYLVDLREEGADISSPESLDNYLGSLSAEWSKINARLKKEGKKKQEGKSPKQRLNSGHITNLYTVGAWERLEGYPTPIRDLQARELEMLNVILTDDTAEILSRNSDILSELDDTYDEALAPYTEDQSFTLPGIVTQVVPTTIKNGPNKGKSMGIVTIEYQGDMLEFAVFHERWVNSQYMWNDRTSGIFKIKHSRNKKTGRTGYNLESCQKLS
jgi:DNA polymerase-3 subunit alpha